MRIGFSTVFAVATLAFGTTAMAQSLYPRECPQPIGYKGFTTELRVASTKATDICWDTVGKRRDARVRFYLAETRLMAVAANLKSSTAEIEKARTDYLEAFAAIEVADKQLTEQISMVCHLYYDWLVDRAQAHLRFDEDGQNAFWPWNTAAQDAVRLPELNKTLVKGWEAIPKKK